jgi:hypothetical protein
MREQRMLHCKGLKRDTANSLWFAQQENPAIIHSTALKRLPRLLRRENGTRRAILQAPGVIGMRMRQHDRVGSQPPKPPQPVESAVDHHAPAAVRDQERSMHTVLAGPHRDLAAGAEKLEMHRPSVLSASDPEINSEVDKPAFANDDGSKASTP